jgi:hypothetical protein
MGDLTKPQGITVHHSATPDQDVLDFPAIVRYHTQVNGWSDIGYHAVVERSERGLVCIYGRPTHRYGAHAQGHNNTLGICFVGNYDQQPPPGVMLDEAIARVLVPWCRQFGLHPRQVYGHREYTGVTKSCPGRTFDMDAFRARLREALS